MPEMHNRKLQISPENYGFFPFGSTATSADATMGVNNIPKKPQNRYPRYSAPKVRSGSSPSCFPTSRGSKMVRVKNVIP